MLGLQPCEHHVETPWNKTEKMEMVKNGEILSDFSFLFLFFFNVWYFYNIDIKDQKIKLPFPTKSVNLSTAF